MQRIIHEKTKSSVAFNSNEANPAILSFVVVSALPILSPLNPSIPVEALKISFAHIEEEAVREKALRDDLEKKLVERIPEVIVKTEIINNPL